MDEILEMSSEINLNILIFHFKGPSPSICFTEFGGPMYTYNQLQKWWQNIMTGRRRPPKKIKSELGHITSGNPEKKNQKINQIQ